MPNPKDTLTAIENTQAELRNSIEQSRLLAEKSQALIDKHRKEQAEIVQQGPMPTD